MKKRGKLRYVESGRRKVLRLYVCIIIVETQYFASLVNRCVSPVYKLTAIFAGYGRHLSSYPFLQTSLPLLRFSF